MNQVVTGCWGCPFHGNAGDDFCYHPKVKREQIVNHYDEVKKHYVLITPDWCPLKSEPLTLTFKSDG